MITEHKDLKDSLIEEYYHKKLRYIFGDIRSELSYISNLKYLEYKYSKIMEYNNVEFWFTDHFIERYYERNIRSNIYHVIIDLIDIYELLNIKYNNIDNFPKRIRLGIRDYMYVIDRKKNKIKIVSSYKLKNIEYIYYIKNSIGVNINFDLISTLYNQLLENDQVDNNLILLGMNKITAYYVNN